MMGFSIKRLEPPLTFSHPDTRPAEGRAAPPRWAAVDPRNPRQRRLKDNRTSRWLKRESNPGRVVQGAGSARGREISVRDPGGISVVFLSRFSSFCPPPSPHFPPTTSRVSMLVHCGQHSLTDQCRGRTGFLLPHADKADNFADRYSASGCLRFLCTPFFFFFFSFPGWEMGR